MLLLLLLHVCLFVSQLNLCVLLIRLLLFLRLTTTSSSSLSVVLIFHPLLFSRHTRVTLVCTPCWELPTGACRLRPWRNS